MKPNEGETTSLGVIFGRSRDIRNFRNIRNIRNTGTNKNMRWHNGEVDVSDVVFFLTITSFFDSFDFLPRRLISVMCIPKSVLGRGVNMRGRNRGRKGTSMPTALETATRESAVILPDSARIRAA